MCPAYCYGRRPAPDTWRRAGSSGCLRSSLLPPFLGGGYKISPLSPRKLSSLCPLPEVEASHLPLFSDAFVPCSAPPSVAAPGFCTLFSWVEWRAAGDADDQGVAAVGMMLGEMRLCLWLSPIIVRPVGNTAHRRTGPRDPWLVPGLGSGHQAAARWQGWLGSQQGVVCTPPAVRLQCGYAKLQLGFQSPG